MREGDTSRPARLATYFRCRFYQRADARERRERAGRQDNAPDRAKLRDMNAISQLPRQLELNLAALSRAFRQALRHAVKTDPQGSEETSAAWQVVAARQTLLLKMMEAVSQFGSGAAAAPENQSLPLVEAANEAVPAAEPAVSDEDLLASLPPEVLEVRNRILAVMKWPVGNHGDRRRQAQELARLEELLERRYNRWKAGQPLPNNGMNLGSSSQ